MAAPMMMGLSSARARPAETAARARPQAASAPKDRSFMFPPSLLLGLRPCCLRPAFSVIAAPGSQRPRLLVVDLQVDAVGGRPERDPEDLFGPRGAQPAAVDIRRDPRRVPHQGIAIAPAGAGAVDHRLARLEGLHVEIRQALELAVAMALPA